ncbi:MAG: pentapeptide repeat-containing protein [Oscillatoriales cyanobacterium RM2_1_1]|nr:pentapeptide repeat-containing protein [Oscillatoriales cyanobacterium SM2_3_0]NJO44390.1 pentapeptide repeat-containing protein [Oscillatoriales cyanobacterium RM2_1_1]
MQYKALGITLTFTSLILGASTVIAQSNSIDPTAFLNGKSRSCQGCDLRGVDLSNSRRVNAQLRQANLSEANLSNGYFEGAFFTCANLAKADLSNAKFPFANFVDADLRGANLQGADLSRTDLSGAIVDQTTVLTDANLEGAKLWDARTIYQPGIDLSTIERNAELERQRVRCRSNS